jgi:acetyltransferase-like isoleucine patch superfamily enzyme
MPSFSAARWVLGLYRLGTSLRNRIFSNSVASAFHEFGQGSTLQLPTTVWGEAGISIGRKVHIGPASWLLCLADPIEAGKPVIEIGDGCSMAGNITITAISSVCIEKGVLFGRNVHISDHAHEFRSLDKPILEQGVTTAKPVRICQGAWLGQGVVVCPGVTIGRNSVIGANSVVKSDIPAGAVAAGAPAKVIRMIAQ